MLFYYTSTGNSLYIAKQLGDKKLIFIPQALKERELNYEEEAIGIVFPDYAGEMPKSVKTFLQRADLKADYIYVICTYGKEHSVCCEYAVKYAKDNGISVNYANAIIMVDNWLPSFDMLEEIAIDKKIPKQIEAVQKDIKSRKHYVELSSEAGRKAYNFVNKRNIDYPEYKNGSALHYNTDLCIGVESVQRFVQWKEIFWSMEKGQN